MDAIILRKADGYGAAHFSLLPSLSPPVVHSQLLSETSQPWFPVLSAALLETGEWLQVEQERVVGTLSVGPCHSLSLKLYLKPPLFLPASCKMHATHPLPLCLPVLRTGVALGSASD